MKLVSAVVLSFSAVFASQSSFAFELKSNDIKAKSTIGSEYVFDGMGCTGKNVSPELHWSGAPKDTKSFAITVYDPDAPTGSGFWHWVAVNIPATTTSLAKGWKPAAADAGLELSNDYGAVGYGGPCPPAGKPHSYIFTVYALKTDKLDLPAGATNAVARFMVHSQILGKTTLTAKYGQK